MDLPLQITWRDIPPSEAVEADIREKAQKLEQFYDHIVSCHVVVEAPHAHHHKGKLYRLHIEIKVPGHAINVSRVPEQNHAHEDLYVTVRDAFDAARRQLQDYARLHRASNARPRKGGPPPAEPATGEEVEE
jgi:ribosomal subunit interface protein